MTLTETAIERIKNLPEDKVKAVLDFVERIISGPTTDPQIMGGKKENKFPPGVIPDPQEANRLLLEIAAMPMQNPNAKGEAVARNVDHYLYGAKKQ